MAEKFANRLQRSDVVAEDLEDRQHRDREQHSRNHPEPAPEYERQEHGDRVQRQSTRDNRRRDQLPFQEGQAGVDGWRNKGRFEIADGKVNRDLLLEADPEPAPQLPQESPLDLPPDFRAPQFGLGD